MHSINLKVQIDHLGQCLGGLGAIKNNTWEQKQRTF